MILNNLGETTTTTTVASIGEKSYSIDIVKKDGSKGHEIVKISIPATILDLKNALKSKLLLTDEKLSIVDGPVEKKDTDDITKGSSFFILKLS